MKNEMLNAARRSNLSRTEISVLVFIIAGADQSGCWTGNRREAAERLRVAKNTIYRNVARLAKLGLIDAAPMRQEVYLMPDAILRLPAYET